MSDDKAPAPKIVYDHVSGNCPVQAEGTINGHSFYFRARGTRWSLGIGGEDCEATPEWACCEKYSEEPYAAGWMTEDEARSFIEKAARLWVEQTKSGSASEVNPISGLPKGESQVVAVVNVGPDWIVAAPEIPEEMVERSARAICQERGDPPDRLYSVVALDCVTVHSQERWHLYTPAARAALTAAGVPALLARIEELEAALAKKDTP